MELKIVDSHVHFMLRKYKNMINIQNANFARKLLLELNYDYSIDEIKKSFEEFKFPGIKVKLEGVSLIPPPIKELSAGVNSDLIGFLNENNDGDIFPSIYLTENNISSVLKIVKKIRLYSVKIYDTDFNSDSILNSLYELKLPLIFHNPFYLEKDNEYQRLIRILDKFAEININVQMAHIGRCYNERCLPHISKISKRYSNLFFDLSTVTNLSVLNYVIDNLSDKVMYGSDLPYSYFFYEAETKDNKLVLKKSDIRMHAKHLSLILQLLLKKKDIIRQRVLRETFFEFINP